MKKFFIVLALLVIGGLFVRFIVGREKDAWVCKGGNWIKEGNPSNSPPQQACLTYFWGNGCPHCQNVDNFLAGWDKKDRVTLDKYEVWYNKKNNQLMQEAYKKCGIEAKNMGVPLLITPEEKCLTGDTPIIEYFKGL